MLKRILSWGVFLPLQSLLLGIFLLFELLHLFRLTLLPHRKEATQESGSSDQLCSIIILNWNGRHLLQESLPALERAVKTAGGEHEVVVVDNGSSDGSPEWMRQNYPHIRFIGLTENLGFGKGNNLGVQEASHDIVVLLNNDMIVSEDFLLPLLEAFNDPQVFAASSQILSPENKQREETGNTQAHFRWGRLHLSHQPIRPCHYTRGHLPVLWAGGGSSAFHRKRFLQLGGFSPLFSPCYVEDTDLSYRAWRQGWKVVLAARSRVVHKHRSSSSVLFTESQINRLIEERKLWYVWRNYPLRRLYSHLLLLPLHLKPSHLSVLNYLQSLRKLPAILSSRLNQPPRAVSDQTLIQWISRPLSYLNHFYPRRSEASQSLLRILIVSAYLPSLGQHGGAGRVFQLLHRVSKKHQVSVVSFVESVDEVTSHLLPHCKRVETVDRGQHIPLSYFPYEPFEEFHTLEFREKLEEILTEEDFDLVHFEWTQMAQYADLFQYTPKLLTEIEVNYAAHQTLLPLEPNPLKKLRKLYNMLQTLYRELELCRRVDQVICVTDTDRSYLERYLYGKTLPVVNTGVDTEFFTCNGAHQSEPGTLLYVGAFRHLPNVDAMLHFCHEIFPRILEERPQTRLYIVGSSPPRSIQDLGSHPQITVTGYVDDIRPFYCKAQVFVVPLRTGVGIRGKILEGWASGKAVVATSLACSGLRALHGENVLVADQPENFAQWTLALLRNPEYCQKLGASGRQTAVQYYDWSLLGEEMIRLYESAGLHRQDNHRDSSSRVF